MTNTLPTDKKDDVTYFAETDYRNEKKKFGIRAEDRRRHAYVIGKTGMGKSTLLENMAVQDIQSGNGVAFVDPHGKSAELLLDYVPEDRIDDVMYFAPFDMEHPISFNVMEDVGEDKRHLVANGLMSAFKKIWVDMWSARMEYLLNNALLALMEYPDSTLLGINRMYADETYRKHVVNNISDVAVRSFWEDEFAEYDERFMRQATAAIQNKIGQFVSNPLVRNIVGQVESSFDLREMMDSEKIILVNLSKGQVGEDNADLLGSMLITKMYLAAMSRSDASEKDLNELPPFYFYVDEFQSFANESFADILSEARKYKLSLTMAHQYIEQMSEEVQDAVFGNVGTMISFRVGAYDAEVLEQEFAPRFEAEDFVNLGFAQIYLKLMINGVGSKPFSARTLPPVPRPDKSYKDAIIEYSRKEYGRPRGEVESQIREWQANPAGLTKSDSERAKEEEGSSEEASNNAHMSLSELSKKNQSSGGGSKSRSKSNNKNNSGGGSGGGGDNSKNSNSGSNNESDKEGGLRNVLANALSGTENEPDDFKKKEDDSQHKSEEEKSDSSKKKNESHEKKDGADTTSQSQQEDADEPEKNTDEKGDESKTSKIDTDQDEGQNQKATEDEDREEKRNEGANDEEPQEIPKSELEELLKVEGESD